MLALMTPLMILPVSIALSMGLVAVVWDASRNDRKTSTGLMHV